MSKISDDINLKFRSIIFDLNEFKDEFKSFVAKSEEKFKKLYEIMDSLAGDFRKFDEEQVLLSGRQSDHSDRLEKLETKVFGISSA